MSIGLEAYAQRDPLVQYKTKATEMFQALLADIRMGVVSRIFTSQVRRAPTQEQNQPAAEQPQQAQPASQQVQSETGSADRKKKRHRH